MPTCQIETAALKAVLKTAKQFGGFENLWLEVGEGKVSFRAGHPGRYAIVGLTIPAPGCEDAPKRFLGASFDKMESAIKSVKGALAMTWAETDEAKGSGLITLKSGGKTRSFLLLAKESEVVVRDVPAIPGQVTATMEVDALKKFFDEAESGSGLVKVEMREGRLFLSAGNKEVDWLEWDAGPCEGEPGAVGLWSAGNSGGLLPTEYDGETMVVKWHPRGARYEWAVGGQPCAMAIASMEEPEG